MDYNFLKKVAKSKDEGRREVQKLDHGTSMTGKRKMHEARRKRWLRIARGRGVEVAELPKWMERRKANRTRFNKGYDSLDFLWANIFVKVGAVGMDRRVGYRTRR